MKAIDMSVFEKREAPIKIILGTDWWTDCDDVVAMRILAWAHHNALIEIKGLAINAAMEYSVASLDAFFTDEGLPSIPIGIDEDATDYIGEPPYQKRMISRAHKYSCNSDACEGVRLYRKILSECEDNIEIIEIGYPQILANLLKSQPDDISDKSGLELVKEKVKKLWMMAGKWDEPDGGMENNFIRNDRSRTAGSYVCENWPTEITFLGWEISYNLITGDNLTSENDMVHMALLDHGSTNGRHSWDPMMVLLAVCHDEYLAGYDIKKGTAKVDPKTGMNTFCEDKNGKHAYVVKNKPDDYYKSAINNILEYRD